MEVAEEVGDASTLWNELRKVLYWVSLASRKKQRNSWPSFRANAYVLATSVFVLPYMRYVQGKIGTCHMSHVTFHSNFHLMFKLDLHVLLLRPMALSRHVRLKERPFFTGFDAVTCYAIYILGHKVDLTRNVTLSRCGLLGRTVDLIRYVTLSRPSNFLWPSATL